MQFCLYFVKWTGKRQFLTKSSLKYLISLDTKFKEPKKRFKNTLEFTFIYTTIVMIKNESDFSAFKMYYKLCWHVYQNELSESFQIWIDFVSEFNNHIRSQKCNSLRIPNMSKCLRFIRIFSIICSRVMTCV